MNFDAPQAAVSLNAVSRLVQSLLDQTVPYALPRWVAFVLLLVVFAIRVLILDGFYIVAYGLAIFLLTLLIAFLSPKFDLDDDDPGLPTAQAEDDEYRPFVRKLPEFKAWVAGVKAELICLLMTFFKIFDIEVYVPVLVIYFIFLFCVMMRRQIEHMIKHKYVPISWGKRRYNSSSQPHDAPPAPSVVLPSSLGKM